MSQQDLIAVVFSDAEQAQVREALNVLRQVLQPKLLTLSAADRRELPKMGDKTVAFVTKTVEYSEQNPALVPSFIDLEAIRVDLRGVELLREFQQVLKPLTAALEDSMILSGSEAYQGSLAIYRNIKSAMRSKVANAEAIFRDLSTRLPGGGRAKVAEPA